MKRRVLRDKAEQVSQVAGEACDLLQHAEQRASDVVIRGKVFPVEKSLHVFSPSRKPLYGEVCVVCDAILITRLLEVRDYALLSRRLRSVLEVSCSRRQLTEVNEQIRDAAEELNDVLAELAEVLQHIDDGREVTHCFPLTCRCQNVWLEIDSVLTPSVGHHMKYFATAAGVRKGFRRENAQARTRAHCQRVNATATFLQGFSITCIVGKVVWSD